MLEKWQGEKGPFGYLKKDPLRVVVVVATRGCSPSPQDMPDALHVLVTHCRWLGEPPPRRSACVSPRRATGPPGLEARSGPEEVSIAETLEQSYAGDLEGAIAKLSQIESRAARAAVLSATVAGPVGIAVADARRVQDSGRLDVPRIPARAAKRQWGDDWVMPPVLRSDIMRARPAQ